MKRILRGLVGLTVLGWCLSWLIPKPLLINRTGFSQVIFDSSGRLMRIGLSGDEKYRVWTPLSEISPLMIEATLLYEDRHFYRHPGVNPIALMKAAIASASERRMGASTITMQLARLRFGLKSRSLAGKIRQITRALQIECWYSKSEILEAYLNLAPYGSNVEGVAAASLIYFGKTPANLTLSESLALAVVPQNPNARSPEKVVRSAEGPLYEARARLRTIWFSRSAGTNHTASVELPAFKSIRSLPFEAPHYTDYLFSRSPYERNIQATIDTQLQRNLERQVASYVERNSARGISNASALLISHRTMQVLSLVGSADYTSAVIQGQVDGTRALRSPGSALKPFIYGLGADQGLIHASSILKDTPLAYAAYNPENFDGDFVGPIKATEALVRSRNLPAIQIANQLSPGMHDFLGRARIRNLKPEEHYGLALTLGGVEVTMRDVASLYAMLANGGELRNLKFTTSDPQEPPIRMLSEEAAFIVMEMLRRNPRAGSEFDERWTRDFFPVHWKTGTSFGFRDAWAAGIFGEYVLVVWVGNFDGRPNPAFKGREAAGPLFFEIIDALKGQGYLKPVLSPVPDGVKKTDVCSLSGQLPGPHCKHREKSWFIPGKSPIHTCAIHREVSVYTDSGLRACRPHEQGTRRVIYEFWSSDLLELFRASGISRRTPPPYAAHCELRSEFGVEPEIVSPQRGVVYNIGNGFSESGIPLSAVSDADARELYWFEDSRFLGKVGREQNYFWHPKPGKYLIRVVDDLGRASFRDVTVRLAGASN